MAGGSKLPAQGKGIIFPSNHPAIPFLKPFHFRGKRAFRRKEKANFKGKISLKGMKFPVRQYVAIFRSGNFGFKKCLG